MEEKAGLRFDPENIRLNKRHTKILGTLNKKTSNEMLTEFIKAGMDGIRVFCDDGYDTVERLIKTARTASHSLSRRVVVCIELRCKFRTL
jgi:pyruvate kinase